MKISATSGPTDDISAIRIGTFTMDPPNILAATSGEATATVSGLDVASNWIVMVSPLASMTANLGIAYARVSADNTISVRFANVSILALDQGSMSFAYVAIK